MTDAKLSASIIPDFSRFRKEAEREGKMDVDVGRRRQRDQASRGRTGRDRDGTGGRGGMLRGIMSILGKIGAAVGIVAAAAKVFEPLFQMISQIFEILAMFLLPVMVLLLPILGFLASILGQILNWWLRMFSEGESIGDIITDALFDIADRIVNGITRALGIPGERVEEARERTQPWFSGLVDLATPIPTGGLVDVGSAFAGLFGFGQEQNQGANRTSNINVTVEGLSDEAGVSDVVNKMSRRVRDDLR